MCVCGGGSFRSSGHAGGDQLEKDLTQLSCESSPSQRSSIPVCLRNSMEKPRWKIRSQAWRSRQEGEKRREKKSREQEHATDARSGGRDGRREKVQEEEKEEQEEEEGVERRGVADAEAGVQTQAGLMASWWSSWLEDGGMTAPFSSAR